MTTLFDTLVGYQSEYCIRPPIGSAVDNLEKPTPNSCSEAFASVLMSTTMAIAHRRHRSRSKVR